MKYLILFAFIPIFVSCGVIKRGITGLQPYQTIIEADDNMELVFGKNYKKWTPTADDVETAEKLLKQGFDDQKMATVNRVEGRTLDQYDRQFVGAINEKGEKIIWINCFSKHEEDTFPDWKSKVVHVQDGGYLFFHLTVNLTTNTYYDFEVNGYG